MREVRLVALDKYRPAVLLTRESVLGYREQITVAGITHTVRGASYEVPVGLPNGIAGPSVINCDDVHTVSADKIGRLLGYLLDDQEEALSEAIISAFDLRIFP